MTGDTRRWSLNYISTKPTCLPNSAHKLPVIAYSCSSLLRWIHSCFLDVLPVCCTWNFVVNCYLLWGFKKTGFYHCWGHTVLFTTSEAFMKQICRSRNCWNKLTNK